MHRFTLKTKDQQTFSHLSCRKPINVYLNPQNGACFSQMINLWGHMHRFSLKTKDQQTFSHLSPQKTHKCVLKASEQGLFFSDDRFKGSHAYVYSTNEHFPIYLLGNPINVC